MPIPQITQLIGPDGINLIGETKKQPNIKTKKINKFENNSWWKWALSIKKRSSNLCKLWIYWQPTSGNFRKKWKIRKKRIEPRPRKMRSLTKSSINFNLDNVIKNKWWKFYFWNFTKWMIWMRLSLPVLQTPLFTILLHLTKFNPLLLFLSIQILSVQDFSTGENLKCTSIATKTVYDIIIYYIHHDTSTDTTCGFNFTIKKNNGSNQWILEQHLSLENYLSSSTPTYPNIH